MLENPVDAEKTKADLELAFHNFYRVTDNKKLTNRLLDDDDLQKEFWKDLTPSDEK